MIVSSHASIIDFLLILETFRKPIGFPVKASFFKIPFVGFVLKSTGCIPINKED